MKKAPRPAKPLLHMVFGGRVKDPRGLDFEDLGALHFVGMYPSYRQAEKAWHGASQAKVDDARFKYVIVHLHRLMQPEDA
jgi:Domain of unknown function (DUF4170)